MDDDNELLFRLTDLGFFDATTPKGQPRLSYMSSVAGLELFAWLRHTDGSHLGMEEPTDTLATYLLAFLCQGPLAIVHCVGCGYHSYAAIRHTKQIDCCLEEEGFWRVSGSSVFGSQLLLLI